MYSYLNVGRASDLENPGERRIYRFFEILPGFLSWLTLLLVFALSFLAPAVIAVFIIIFDVYWVVKIAYLMLHLRASYNRMRHNTAVDWQEKLEKLSPAQYTLANLKSWQDIYHLIFLPIYKEDYVIVAATIEAILKSDYPKSKMAVVLCYEERGGEETEKVVKEAIKNYGRYFLEFSAIKHPAGLEGEIPGKGSNSAYAAKIIKETFVDRLGLAYEHIIVSNFDIDTVCPVQYFSNLTYTFLISVNPLRASYQPIPLYINNIWEAPSFARVVAFGTTFWQKIQQERWEAAMTYSSHSMPFKALVDVGFWQKNIVSEDSRIFAQCLLRYDGDYRIVSLYFPVAMDANVAPTIFQTFKNVYKQQRRWSYGVENIPYLFFGFMKNKAISFSKKLRFGFIVTEGFHSWATNALMLFALGWLPVIVGGSAFNRTVLSFNLPFLTQFLLTISMVGLVTSAVLSLILLPPRPPRYGKFKYFWMLLQWLLFPFTTIIFGSFPALDSQTRLMLGKYMGFWSTPKARIKN